MRFAFAALCAILAASTVAQPSWNYAESAYAYLDADFVDDPFHGFSVAGTVEVADYIHLRWDASTVRFVDDDVAVGVALEGESAGIAVGFHLPASANAAVYGRLGVDYTRASASVSVLGRTFTASEDGTGYDAEVGLRAGLTDHLELQIALVYDDVSEDTVVGSTVAIRLADPVAFTVGVGGNGDVRSVAVGMRVHW